VGVSYPFDRLARGAADLGITLTSEQIVAIDRYVELLLFWNRRINLTAITIPEEILDKHILDSLAVTPYVPAAARSLIDVGSGAGFPGAIIALVRPDLAVTLVESSHKKAAFLSTLRRELPLPNITVDARRVEDVARGQADVAVSRATWALPTWLVLGQALVRPGGLVLGMEGAELHDLPVGAIRHPCSLPGSQRSIVTLQTHSST
jgi:16S rRNA (guanine527-N7)-methyltransferase